MSADLNFPSGMTTVVVGSWAGLGSPAAFAGPFGARRPGTVAVEQPVVGQVGGGHHRPGRDDQAQGPAPGQASGTISLDRRDRRDVQSHAWPEPPRRPPGPGRRAGLGPDARARGSRRPRRPRASSAFDRIGSTSSNGWIGSGRRAATAGVMGSACRGRSDRGRGRMLSRTSAGAARRGKSGARRWRRRSSRSGPMPASGGPGRSTARANGASARASGPGRPDRSAENERSGTTSRAEVGRGRVPAADVSAWSAGPSPEWPGSDRVGGGQEPVPVEDRHVFRLARAGVPAEQVVVMLADLARGVVVPDVVEVGLRPGRMDRAPRIRRLIPRTRETSDVGSTGASACQALGLVDRDGESLGLDPHDIMKDARPDRQAANGNAPMIVRPDEGFGRGRATAGDWRGDGEMRESGKKMMLTRSVPVVPIDSTGVASRRLRIPLFFDEKRPRRGRPERPRIPRSPLTSGASVGCPGKTSARSSIMARSPGSLSPMNRLPS